MALVTFFAACTINFEKSGLFDYERLTFYIVGVRSFEIDPLDEKKKRKNRQQPKAHMAILQDQATDRNMA